MSFEQSSNVEAAAVAGTVLYIDDSPTMTILVERIVSGIPGVAFGSAPDGRTGLERAARLQPDLVLLDLRLPDLGGEQVLARLRADRSTRAIPVIVLTAETDPAVHHRLLAGGAQWILTKPFEVTDLLRVVDGSLRAGRL
ncbi:MAG TPA: response regulator [Rugosimonospora sp.]|nr:response regulator [Rugosimonospora sp.]